MGWETRGNRRYYYRKRWVDGRPVSEYVGGGDIGKLCASTDRLDRHERNIAAAEWWATVENERRQDEALSEIDQLVKSAVAAVLITNGYHAHKRQWRKMR